MPMTYSRGVLSGSIDVEGGYQSATITLSSDLKSIQKMEIIDHKIETTFGQQTIRHKMISIHDIPSVRLTFEHQLLAYFIYGADRFSHVTSYQYTIDTHDPSGKSPDQHILNTTDYARETYQGFRIDIYSQ
jgi:hypothetical protein